MRKLAEVEEAIRLGTQLDFLRIDGQDKTRLRKARYRQIDHKIDGQMTQPCSQQERRDAILFD